MARHTLTETRFANGSWHGVLEGPKDAPPKLEAVLRGTTLPGLAVSHRAAGGWSVVLPIPPEAVGEGIHTITIGEPGSAEPLARVTLAAGAPLARDLDAELSLMRAELDLLKRAFRRHCAEAEETPGAFAADDDRPGLKSVS